MSGNSTSEARCTACAKPRSSVPAQSFSRCGRCHNALYCCLDCQAKDWPTHKESCKRQNYILRIHLEPDNITDPPIWRTLSVPATTTFATLHGALQIAFDWADMHWWDFVVHDPEYREQGGLLSYINERAYQDRQMGIDEHYMGNPHAARKFLMRIVDEHRWEKMRHERRGIAEMDSDGLRKHPRTVEKKAGETKVFSVFDLLDRQRQNGQDQKMDYVYDWGDGWEHRITIEGRADYTEHIVCIDGEGHGVFEDCGGPDGWAEVKEMYRMVETPTTQEQEFNMSKYQGGVGNFDHLGLHNGGERRWSKDEINRRLIEELRDGYHYRFISP